MQIKLRGGRVTKRLTGKIKLPAGQHTEAMQTKSVEPSLEEQVLIPDTGYAGLSRVTVGGVPLQAKTATPGAAAQVVEADEGAMGLSRVTVEGAPLQRKTVKPTTGTQTVEADAGYYGLGAVEVRAAKFQGKVVTPGTAQQFITPDAGYDGLNGVAVLPEPDLTPENIKQGVTIFGVTGSYNGETSGEGGDDNGGGSGGDNTGGDNTGGGTQTATMYSYNGTVLPALPEWDKTTYPYAAIIHDSAYIGSYFLASSASFCLRGGKLTNDAGDGGIVYKVEADIWATYNGAINGVLEVVDATVGALNALLWANHEVLNEDGTTCLSASVPTALKNGDTIEVKYSGEVLTEAGDDSTACVSEQVTMVGGISSVETYRITVDGDSVTEQKMVVLSRTTYGNAYLYDTTKTDTGGDWCVRTQPGAFYLYTKDPGRHSVKIERLFVEE